MPSPTRRPRPLLRFALPQAQVVTVPAGTANGNHRVVGMPVRLSPAARAGRSDESPVRPADEFAAQGGDRPGHSDEEEPGEEARHAGAGKPHDGAKPDRQPATDRREGDDKRDGTGGQETGPAPAPRP